MGKGRIRAKTGIGKDSSVNHAYVLMYIHMYLGNYSFLLYIGNC